jgi:hypothetical protein
MTEQSRNGAATVRLPVPPPPLPRPLPPAWRRSVPGRSATPAFRRRRIRSPADRRDAAPGKQSILAGVEDRGTVYSSSKEGAVPGRQYSWLGRVIAQGQSWFAPRDVERIATSTTPAAVGAEQVKRLAANLLAGVGGVVADSPTPNRPFWLYLLTCSTCSYWFGWHAIESCMDRHPSWQAGVGVGGPKCMGPSSGSNHRQSRSARLTGALVKPRDGLVHGGSCISKMCRLWWGW